MAIMSPYGNLLNLRNTVHPVNYGGMQQAPAYPGIPGTGMQGSPGGIPGNGMQGLPSPGYGIPSHAVGPQPYGGSPGYATPPNFSSIPGNGMGGYPAPSPAPSIPGNGMNGIGAPPAYGLPIAHPVGPQPYGGQPVGVPAPLGIHGVHAVGPQQYGGMQGQPNYSNLLMMRRMGLQ